MPVGFAIALAGTIVFLFSAILFAGQKAYFQYKLQNTQNELAETKEILQKTQKDKDYLDKKQINEELERIKKTYILASKSYEELLKLKEITKTGPLDEQYAEIISFLSLHNYASAESSLADLNTKIKSERSKAESAATAAIPENITTNNTPPGAGYRRQYVKNDYGTYMVDIVAADLNSSRVVVDTASEGTCTNDCPVMSLGAFAGRSGAFAGINGPYFCPSTYPACADKKNSFDTLLMNKNKTYFNSDNNIYSNVPAIIFQGNSARYVGRSLEWGGDTGPDSVIASQPLLVLNGSVVFGGDDEIKRSGKGSRSFLGSTGNTAYMGVVYNANVAEVAEILKTMGVNNAINLDSGGSTALWTGGRYVAGPGRDTPFGILFVGK